MFQNYQVSFLAQRQTHQLLYNENKGNKESRRYFLALTNPNIFQHAKVPTQAYL